MSWPPDSSELVCSKWLRESVGKRRAFELCYGDLIGKGLSGTVVDVGGGLSHLTERLCRTNRYTLVDPLHHVSRSEFDNLSAYADGSIVKRMDWFEFSFDNSDLVIANDIFPNVDFRLDAFLQKISDSMVQELRIVLTVFSDPKSFKVRKVESGELLTVVAIPTQHVIRQLRDFCPLGDFSPIQRPASHDSDWKNGRFMFFLNFKRNNFKLGGRETCEAEERGISSLH